MASEKIASSVVSGFSRTDRPKDCDLFTMFSADGTQSPPKGEHYVRFLTGPAGLLRAGARQRPLPDSMTSICERTSARVSPSAPSSLAATRYVPEGKLRNSKVLVRGA